MVMSFAHSLLASPCFKVVLETLLSNIEVEMKTDHPVFLYLNSRYLLSPSLMGCISCLTVYRSHLVHIC